MLVYILPFVLVFCLCLMMAETCSLHFTGYNVVLSDRNIHFQNLLISHGRLVWINKG